MTKEFYKSKTFWFNVVAAVVLAVTTIWPEFGDFQVNQDLATIVVVLVNLALRFVTRVPITL